MTETLKESAKLQYGKQLKKYREQARVSQQEVAKYLGTGKSYISQVENGEVSVGLDILEKIADFFGVKYFNMADPDYAIPPFEQMPKAIRDYVAQQKQKKVLAQQAKTAKEEKLMKELLKSSFLRKPKTAEEIAAKLSSKIILKPSRVKALLREKGLKELVKVVAGKGMYVLRGE